MSEKDFIFSKIKELSLTGIKNFPVDFITSKQLTEIEVPEKVLLLGKEFFGSFEVISATGDFSISFNDEFEAKYVVYASHNRKSKMKMPAEKVNVRKAVEEYEKYLDKLLQELKNDYLRKFSGGKNFTLVSNEIFKKLNLIRL